MMSRSTAGNARFFASRLRCVWSSPFPLALGLAFCGASPVRAVFDQGFIGIDLDAERFPEVERDQVGPYVDRLP